MREILFTNETAANSLLPHFSLVIIKMYELLSEHLQKSRKLFTSYHNFYDSKVRLIDDPLHIEDIQREDRETWFRAQETVIKVGFLFS